MDKGEDTPGITMGEEKEEIQYPEDPALGSRSRSRQGRKRLRPAEEQNNNEETHTLDTLERQIEKLLDDDKDEENAHMGNKTKERGK